MLHARDQLLGACGAATLERHRTNQPSAIAINSASEMLVREVRTLQVRATHEGTRTHHRRSWVRRDRREVRVMRAVRHVLMTADTIGEVWTYALELIGAFAAEGIDVTLATMGREPSRAQSRAAAALPNLDLRNSDYALEWMPDAWRDVDEAGEWLLDLERRTEADIVHVNGFVHAALPFTSPVVTVAHACVCSWWRAVRGTDAPPEWDDYRWRVAAGISAADAVIAPTRAILDDVLAAHEIPPPRVTHVIANGRSIHVTPAATREPFVLAAGQLWDEAKNLTALDDCAARVPWPIYVAGSLDHPGRGAAVAPRAVHAIGELRPADLFAWMRRAAIYALPARYEPFGLSALEAALAGCALVLGDLPSLREVWGDAAVYVPPFDASALGHALAALAKDTARRDTLAARARARAAMLTPTRMAAGYLAVYDVVRGQPEAAA